MGFWSTFKKLFEHPVVEKITNIAIETADVYEKVREVLADDEVSLMEALEVLGEVKDVLEAIRRER